jgi:hypothetical protein
MKSFDEIYIEITEILNDTSTLVPVSEPAYVRLQGVRILHDVGNKPLKEPLTDVQARDYFYVMHNDPSDPFYKIAANIREWYFSQ